MKKNNSRLTILHRKLKTITAEERTLCLLSEAANNKVKGSKFIKPSFAWFGLSYNR